MACRVSYTREKIYSVMILVSFLPNYSLNHQSEDCNRVRQPHLALLRSSPGRKSSRPEVRADPACRVAVPSLASCLPSVLAIHFEPVLAHMMSTVQRARISDRDLYARAAQMGRVKQISKKASRSSARSSGISPSTITKRKRKHMPVRPIPIQEYEDDEDEEDDENYEEEDEEDEEDEEEEELIDELVEEDEDEDEDEDDEDTGDEAAFDAAYQAAERADAGAGAGAGAPAGPAAAHQSAAGQPAANRTTESQAAGNRGAFSDLDRQLLVQNTQSMHSMAAALHANTAAHAAGGPAAPAPMPAAPAGPQANNGAPRAMWAPSPGQKSFGHDRAPIVEEMQKTIISKLDGACTLPLHT